VQVPITFYDDQWRPDPAGLNFRGTLPVENGGDSGVVQACYLRWIGGPWGGGTFRAAALTPDMQGIADTGWTTLNPGYGKDFWTIPDGHPADVAGRPCRSIYVEGRREHPAVPVSVFVLPLAK
jgi:hypothetical protein